MSAEKKITYEAFTERVAKRANVSESEADAYIHQFAKTAGDALEEGDEVQLYHFGRFRTTHVDERLGHNPGTGEALIVPDHTRVDFQPYKALLIAVNLPFRHLRTRMLTEENADKRPAISWLLLALALLVLILAIIGISTWMSRSGNITAAPAESPAAMSAQQPVIGSPPVTTLADADTSTPAASATETETTTATEPDATTDTPVAPVAATTTITVSPGDTLWGISQAQWGDTSWWPVIYAQNRATLADRNPDLIETGSSLHIPALAGSAAQPTSADLRQRAAAYRTVAGDYERLGHARASEYRRVANRESTTDSPAL